MIFVEHHKKWEKHFYKLDHFEALAEQIKAFLI